MMKVLLHESYIQNEDTFLITKHFEPYFLVFFSILKKQVNKTFFSNLINLQT